MDLSEQGNYDDAINCLNKLHMEKLVHGDIKSHNFVVDFPSCDVHIIDYGTPLSNVGSGHIRDIQAFIKYFIKDFKKIVSDDYVEKINDCLRKDKHSTASDLNCYQGISFATSPPRLPPFMSLSRTPEGTPQGTPRTPQGTPQGYTSPTSARKSRTPPSAPSQKRGRTLMFDDSP
jgi:serine/threonine protein kinase